MATQSTILTWKIPWTEEPGGLPSMKSQRVGHTEWLSVHIYTMEYCSQIKWIDHSYTPQHEPGHKNHEHNSNQTKPDIKEHKLYGSLSLKVQKWGKLSYGIYLYIYLKFGANCMTYRISVPWPGIKLGPRQQKHWVLTTGALGNSLSYNT